MMMIEVAVVFDMNPMTLRVAVVFDVNQMILKLLWSLM